MPRYVALLADLHARGSDLDTFEAQLHAVLEACTEHQVEALFLAGDVFDYPNVGDRHASTGSIVRALRAALDPWPVYAIPGNHDKRNEAQRDALTLLESPRFTVWRDAAWHVLPELDLAVAALPWIWGRDAATALELLASAPPSEPTRRLLLGHAQVLGARMNGTTVCEHGAFTLAPSQLHKFPADRIALGDFHQRQELVPERGGYVGALRQMNFGEEGNPAGFELWDLESNQVTWVELTHAPRHRTYRWTSQDQEQPLAYDSQWHQRVRIEGYAPNPTQIQEWTSRGIRVDLIPAASYRIARAGAAELPAVTDLHGMLDLYLSNLTPPPSEPDRDRLHRALDQL